MAGVRVPVGVEHLVTGSAQLDWMRELTSLLRQGAAAVRALKIRQINSTILKVPDGAWIR